VNTRKRKTCAFTLAEVLVVVTIISIAAAVVVPRLLHAGTFSVQAAGRCVIADIIFAQNDAVAHQKTRKIIFDTANNAYRLTDENDETLAAGWIGGGAYVISFANDPRFNGVTLANVDFGGSTTIEFDDLGAPVIGGVLDVVGTETQYRITVAALTGRVTIEPVAGG